MIVAVQHVPIVVTMLPLAAGICPLAKKDSSIQVAATLTQSQQKKFRGTNSLLSLLHLQRAVPDLSP
jgi:hypothetical protein